MLFFVHQKDLKIGDAVYIPSCVELEEISYPVDWVYKLIKNQKPSVGIVLEKLAGKDSCIVLYKNKTCIAKYSYLYKIEKEEEKNASQVSEGS